jgi:hypothetical protein
MSMTANEFAALEQRVTDLGTLVRQMLSAKIDVANWANGQLHEDVRVMRATQEQHGQVIVETSTAVRTMNGKLDEILGRLGG